MLITEEYRKLQGKPHQNPHYGMASVVYAALVSDLIRRLGGTAQLHYGAG